MDRDGIPTWAQFQEGDYFEVFKLGYMKRFVMCQTPESAVELGHIVHMANASLTRLHPRWAADAAMHYYLPDDTALATFELIAYFTGDHQDGDHMRGRLTNQGDKP